MSKKDSEKKYIQYMKKKLQKIKKIKDKRSENTILLTKYIKQNIYCTENI